MKEKEEKLNFEKVWKMFQETDKKFQKQMKELQKEIGGIGKSNGEVAEDFFYNGLYNSMKISYIDIGYIDRNIKRYSKKLSLTDEFDIILTNDNLLIIVEVKYKVREEHIETLLKKKIPNFKKLFPRYSDLKIQGAIAGFTFDKDTVELATKYGFYVLTQSGDNIKYLNDKELKFY